MWHTGNIRNVRAIAQGVSTIATAIIENSCNEKDVCKRARLEGHQSKEQFYPLNYT
jgi:hypothetical protein